MSFVSSTCKVLNTEAEHAPGKKIMIVSFPITLVLKAQYCAAPREQYCAAPREYYIVLHPMNNVANTATTTC